jgi:hypothetical protein
VCSGDVCFTPENLILLTLKRGECDHCAFASPLHEGITALEQVIHWPSNKIFYSEKYGLSSGLRKSMLSV